MITIKIKLDDNREAGALAALASQLSPADLDRLANAWDMGIERENMRSALIKLRAALASRGFRGQP